MSRNRSVAAYAVIENDCGQVLLTRRRGSDDWVLPGGSVEGKEAPWEAMVREPPSTPTPPGMCSTS